MSAETKEQRDCGVCGIPAEHEVKVTDDGYTVPRCESHIDARPYQAESRLEQRIEAESGASDDRA